MTLTTLVLIAINIFLISMTVWRLMQTVSHLEKTQDMTKAILDRWEREGR